MLVLVMKSHKPISSPVRAAEGEAEQENDPAEKDWHKMISEG
jgi:hypothetical protein